MSVPQLTMAVNPLTAEWQAVQFVRELWSITEGRTRCWARNSKLKKLFECSVDTIGRRVKVAERLGLIRTEYLPGLRRIIHLLVYPNLPDVSGEYAAPVRTACGDPLLIVSLPKDLNTENTTNTTASEAKTAASEAVPVVVSKEEEGETAKEPEPVREPEPVTPRNIPTHDVTLEALIRDISAIPGIPATDAARAVRIDPARARNAASVVKATKRPGNPLSLFWASFHQGWTPNPPPDPKPRRIATEGAKTTNYRPVVESVGGLTGWAACEAVRARMKTAGHTERART